ncbi:aminotransferase class I/II-fold pyridoxal phosphate-dependent enzyme [Brevibacterium sp. XM4083]|uniref:aminotransferase class I/II-fold pyridoxal phosphate-dependent enzyme n=1 Tax=Brevibacterium sp. XM4083 TaxID=2583238 RepID=UPI002030709D|nr:aminotransferase class I/II-fold pyridoxal phosphate-dependent enzyme [Brevibacterium sp. XM4083]
MTAPVREANRILDRLDAEARARAEAGLDRADAGAHGLDLASNDYLGLANHPRVIAAGREAIARWGTSARASRLVTGTTPAHHEAEAALSALTGRDTALVFSSGYTANLAVLTALSGPDCLIVSDAHNHASLIDACRLSKAEVVRTPHGDATAVEEALRQRTRPEAIVVVESVYSVLGDAPDLAGLLELCARFDALLVIDEAHGIGVVGGGAGAAAALEDHRDRVVVTATLSKALGAQGGAVLGPAAVREALVNTARTFIFDTGLAPAAAAAATAAIRLIAAGEAPVAQLAANRRALTTSLGIAEPAGAVASVPMSSARAAVAARDALRERGLTVGCFRPPSVPDGVSRLRITCRGDLTPSAVDTAAAAIGAVVAEMG